MNLNWICKYCASQTTLTDPHIDMDRCYLNVIGLKNDENIDLIYQALSCPNPECKKLTLKVSLISKGIYRPNTMGYSQSKNAKTIHTWNLLPEPSGKPQPDYIPKAIQEDYYEACKIRELSPKASASLARRCLQGMIRDFWGVKDKPNLKQEIEAIKEKVQPELWKAIDGVREMGNIGAHMEQDVNLIIDIDPDEAQTLIKLIELLFEEWYIAKHDREERIRSVVEILDEKTEHKKSNKGTEPKAKKS